MKSVIYWICELRTTCRRKCVLIPLTFSTLYILVYILSHHLLVNPLTPLADGGVTPHPFSTPLNSSGYHGNQTRGTLHSTHRDGVKSSIVNSRPSIRTPFGLNNTKYPKNKTIPNKQKKHWMYNINYKNLMSSVS